MTVPAGRADGRRNTAVAVLRRRRIDLLLWLVLALALVLRLDGISYGLPYSLVNADESTVIPMAFKAARGHLNPQFFFYPSLYFYLVAALCLLATPLWALLGHGNLLAEARFVVDATPYFLLGRLLSAAMGVAAVYLVYRLGRVAYGRPAGLLAALFLAVSPLHVAYSHMAVTDVTAVTFSLLAFALLQAAMEAGRGVTGAGDDGRRRRRLLLAGAVVAGLATSTKYNLGLLVLPATLAAVLVYRRPTELGGSESAAARGRAWLWLLGRRVYLPMVAAFVAASPFVLLDAPHFVRDFRRQSAIMERGWLGFEQVNSGFWYNLTPNLTGAIGVPLTVLGIAGLVWALWRLGRAGRRLASSPSTRLDLLAVPYVTIYYAYIGTWKELADRYLLVIAPLLVILAARLIAEMVTLARRPFELRPSAAAAGTPSRSRRGRSTASVVVLVATMVVVAVSVALPLSASLAFNRDLSGPDTREIAKRWIERHLPAGSYLALENYSPPVVLTEQLAAYRDAGREPVAYRVMRLKLPLPGYPEPMRDVARLQAAGVEYVVTSSRVRERIMAASATYPESAAFYRRLDAEAEQIKVIRPGAGERGPVLRIYRLMKS